MLTPEQLKTLPSGKTILAVCRMPNDELKCIKCDYEGFQEAGKALSDELKLRLNWPQFADIDYCKTDRVWITADGTFGFLPFDKYSFVPDKLVVCPNCGEDMFVMDSYLCDNCKDENLPSERRGLQKP